MENDELLLIISTSSNDFQRHNSHYEATKIFTNGKIIQEISSNNYNWDTKKSECKYGKSEAILTKEELANLNKEISKIIKKKFKKSDGVDTPDCSTNSSLTIYKNKKQYIYSIKTTGKYSDILHPILNNIKTLREKYKLKDKIILENQDLNKTIPTPH